MRCLHVGLSTLHLNFLYSFLGSVVQEDLKEAPAKKIEMPPPPFGGDMREALYSPIEQETLGIVMATLQLYLDWPSCLVLLNSIPFKYVEEFKKEIYRKRKK